MTEHPILFSAPMVRAILDGTKTQTRRHLYVESKNCATACFDRRYPPPSYGSGDFPNLPPGSAWTLSRWRHVKPGDQLWVRETFQRFTDDGETIYKADPKSFELMNDLKRDECQDARWKPAIHMPRWASRITLEITGVRVERLQAISEADAKAEGCQRLDDDEPGYVHRDEPDWKLCPRCGGTRLYTAFNPATGGALPDTDCKECDTYVKRYRHLWESINGPESWAANPWVWVVEFKRTGGAA